VALPVAGGVAALGIADPDRLGGLASLLTWTVFRAIDWFFLVLATGLLVIAVWLALGRYGGVKLGQPEDEPEFTTLSWLAMLFAAGMGVGLLFWSVAEPVLHYATAPGVERGSTEAARHAMTVTLFHWSLHAWAVYCVAALALAYFGFRRRTSYMPGACIQSAFAGCWVAPVAWLADLIAVLAVALGVAGSIAMGVFQLQRGLFVLAGVDATSTAVAGMILGVLVVAYLPPLALPLDKGIQWLSSANMLIAVGVLVYLLVAGPTAFLLRSFVASFGDYAAQIVPLSFQLYPFQGTDVSGWFRSWTLTYFIWWIAWSPFVGVFIARISRGRTIREFVAGVLVVPSVFSVLWFAVFGGTALYEERYGLGGVVAIVRHDVSIALFTLFERLPFADVLNVTAIGLAFVFLVTSIVSAAYVLGMLTEGGSLDPSVRSKLAWGVLLAALGAAMMLSGDVEAVRSVTVVGAIPFSFVLILQVAALVGALSRDSRVVTDPITAAEIQATHEMEEAKAPEAVAESEERGSP
jgi:glycine betaine transporter